MHHADFRVALVEDDRVFIVEPATGGNTVTDDAKWVWDRVSELYPNRRIICRDFVTDRWGEIVPVHPTDRMDVVTVNFRPYDEHVPF